MFRSIVGDNVASSSSAASSASSSSPSPIAPAFATTTPIGPAGTTDSALASGKDTPLARSDAFQSSARAGKRLGGGGFPETGDPTTGNQIPVPATLSSKAQTAASSDDVVPQASGQLPTQEPLYEAEASTISAATARKDKVLDGIALGSAKAPAATTKKGEEGKEEEQMGAAAATSALAAAAAKLSSSPSPSSSSFESPSSKPNSYLQAKPLQLAKYVAPAGPNSQAASWPNVSSVAPEPPPGTVPTLRSMDPNIAALDASQGAPLVPASSVLSDGSIAGGNANYGKQVAATIAANLSYPGPGLKGEKVTVCHFPSPTFQGTGADPYTVRPLFLPPPAADLLLSSAAGNGFDFAAPPPGSSVFGPGCVSYDSRCSFGYNGIPCSGHGVCQSTLPNSCLCASGWKSCGVPGSNGCETNTNRDVNNCGKVS